MQNKILNLFHKILLFPFKLVNSILAITFIAFSTLVYALEGEENTTVSNLVNCIKYLFKGVKEGKKVKAIFTTQIFHDNISVYTYINESKK